jgi:SAM-dependent methyltransferase
VVDPIAPIVAAFASTVPAGGSVLDVGCGTRPYEGSFKHARYVGIDVETSGRAATEKRPDRFYDGVNIPYPDGSFDAVICTEVLEHVVDVRQVMSEMERVLTTGGRLLLTIPFMWGEHEAPYDFLRWSTFGATRLVEEANLRIVSHEKLVRGVDAIATLVASEVLTYAEQHPARGVGRRAGIWLTAGWWRVQLALWRRLYRFERVFIDNAIVAVKEV